MDADFCISQAYVMLVFIILEHFCLRGAKQKKQEKKHEILAFKPILQEIRLKNLSERFSKALTSKL